MIDVYPSIVDIITETQDNNKSNIWDILYVKSVSSEKKHYSIQYHSYEIHHEAPELSTGVEFSYMPLYSKCIHAFEQLLKHRNSISLSIFSLSSVIFILYSFWQLEGIAFRIGKMSMENAFNLNKPKCIYNIHR